MLTSVLMVLLLQMLPINAIAMPDLKREMRDSVSHSSMKARRSSTQQFRSFSVSMVNFTLGKVEYHLRPGQLKASLSVKPAS